VRDPLCFTTVPARHRSFRSICTRIVRRPAQRRVAYWSCPGNRKSGLLRFSVSAPRNILNRCGGKALQDDFPALPTRDFRRCWHRLMVE